MIVLLPELNTFKLYQWCSFSYKQIPWKVILFQTQDSGGYTALTVPPSWDKIYADNTKCIKLYYNMDSSCYCS